jgi:predicted dinucleotide-binding enzyme
MLGTGDVGQALGRAFVTLGHDVLMGAREAGNAKAAAWAGRQGPRASAGTFADAAVFGELVVLATLGVANESALALAGPDNLRGKIVIDATNPLDFSRGMPPSLAVGGQDSGGERVQRQLPDAFVVKSFNTVGNALMFRPNLPGGPPDMFICGNDAGAKARVIGLLGEFGWNAIDLGGIESSRYLEAMCMVWVLAAQKTNNWSQAFKLLKA